MRFIFKAFRILVVLILAFSIYVPIDAQSSNTKKEKRVKPAKTKNRPSSNRAIPSSYNEDLVRFLDNFNKTHQEARLLNNQYRLARVMLVDQVNDLKKAKPPQKTKIVQIEARIKALKKQEKVALSNEKKFRKYAQSLEGIQALSLSKQNKIVASIEANFQKMPRVFPPPNIKPLGSNERPMVQSESPSREGSANSARATRTANSTRTRATTSSNSQYATYDRNKDVMYNPPPPSCEFQFKGVDEFLGKEKIEVKPSLFFFHTDPELRTYMKGNEYIECKAGMATSTGGLTTLNIVVTIRSQNAQREFGSLQKGNPLTIKLVNGEIVKLLSVNSDSGIYDQATGLTTFRNQFLVQKGEEKSFLESEIDKVRLVWSNGYEDYDVFNVDFMMNQINCLYSN